MELLNSWTSLLIHGTAYFVVPLKHFYSLSFIADHCIFPGHLTVRHPERRTGGAITNNWLIDWPMDAKWTGLNLLMSTNQAWGVKSAVNYTRTLISTLLRSNSRPFRFRITILGKLLTDMVLSPSSIIMAALRSRCGHYIFAMWLPAALRAEQRAGI